MKKLNLDIVFKIIILFSYSFMFYIMISSGMIKDFVHPRIIPYIILSSIVMIISVFCLIFYIGSKPKVRRSFKSYIIFFIPLLIGFILKMNYKANSQVIKMDSDRIPIENIITIDNDNFIDLCSKSSEYLLKNIEAIGFIKSTNNMNEFILGRNIMTCCVADLDEIGIRCVVKDNIKLDDYTWVSIKGVVKEDKITNESYVEITNLKSVNEPTDKFLYLY